MLGIDIGSREYKEFESGYYEFLETRDELDELELKTLN